MSELVSLSKDGAIGIITVNNPPVNALSPGVPDGIGAAIEEILKDDIIQAAILMGAGSTFIAGADIRVFEKIVAGEAERLSIHPLLLALEDCPKPVIAAIHGTALGGGLEVAMACHYRVALASAQVGQPEVKLGLIPGAGGTHRLPRLAGVAKAVEMCAYGNPVRAGEALDYGLIDKLIEEDVLYGALKFARDVVSRGEAPPKTRERTDKLGDPQTNAAILASAREEARKRLRGQIAPLASIDSVEAAITLPFDEWRAKEAELFKQCLFSDQSKSLIHVFFGERTVAKIPDVPKDTPVREIRRAAVVGGGTMGSGIAMAYANAGLPVILKEVTPEALNKSLITIEKSYAGSVKKGRLGEEAMKKRLGYIQPTLSYEGFDNADIIVEAVFEGMDVKKQVFRELNDVCKPDAILASNTSTLDIDEMASVTSRPDMVIGHHFFSPAHIMRLLEIVRGQATSNEVIATSMALAKRLGKVGVLVGNCRGFVGNRMYGCYKRESEFLLEEGARIEQVDYALVEFGMAMGPMAVGDLSGLDVGWRIRKEFKDWDPPGLRRPLVADRLCELGRYGQKTGAGYYRYDENRRASPDPDVQALIEQSASEAGITRRAVDLNEIVDRTIYALVNEGAKILEEGFVLRSVDIDIIYVNGYGFPAWRGGPMWYADTVGLKKVYERVCEFHRQHGELWKPANLLQELAGQGKTFAGFDKEKRY